MKKNNPIVAILLIICVLASSSCRKEDSEYVGETPADRLPKNANITNLLSRITMNDGSYDNIIDQASCFSVKLPVTVFANETQIIVNTADDLDRLEDLISERNDENNRLTIIFPITIILSDFTEVTLTSNDELQAYANTCEPVNTSDSDVECIDIQYPIEAAYVNVNSGAIETKAITNDKKLFDFLEDLNNDVVVSLNFPITVILSDRSEIEISSIEELENVINEHKDDCDELDTNQMVNDCANCEPDDLVAIWAFCSEWTVKRLKVDQLEVGHIYEDFVFKFNQDGTLLASSSLLSYSGSWTTSGTGNDILLTINIPQLPNFHFNGTWNLINIKNFMNGNNGKIRLNFKTATNNKLRFKQNCD